MKPSDLDPHSFPLWLKKHAYNLNAAFLQEKNWGVGHTNIQHEGAQWLSGRVLDSRPKGRGFRHIYPSLVLVQSRKTRPHLTERLLMGCKESNKKNKQTNKINIINYNALTHWEQENHVQTKQCKIRSEHGHSFAFIGNLFGQCMRLQSLAHQEASKVQAHVRRLAWTFAACIYWV